MTAQLVRREQESTEIQQFNSANPIGAMLQAVLAKGITAENVAAMEKLVGLYERMEDRNAMKEFAAAKAALQAELPKVVANKIIPSKDGTVRSRFANYEAIMEAIGPFLTKHGFSVSFTIRMEQNRACAVCCLTHVGGHSESNEFAVRVGSGPPQSSEAQADGAARSYARRGALCDALNIVVDHDNDARLEGDYITPKQAQSLKTRVHATGTDEKKFLNYAGADSYETIRDVKFRMLDEMLQRKEKSPPEKRTANPLENAKDALWQEFVARAGSIPPAEQGAKFYALIKKNHNGRGLDELTLEEINAYANHLHEYGI